MKRFFVACLLGSLSLHAVAARPFVTDDARLTNAGSCQLESWARLYRDSHETWALPACNPTGNFEVTAGGGYARSDNSQGTNDYVLQAKTLFRPLETNGWGIGLGLGTVHHPKISPGPNLLGNTYAYVPVSFSFDSDRLIVHTNVGWLRDRASGNNNMTWGVGGEFQASPRLLLIAETFGDHRNQPYWQIGGRVSIIPNLVQIDTTVGQQFTGPVSSRWLSFGIRLNPESLF
jgi:hypothetical protein